MNIMNNFKNYRKESKLILIISLMIFLTFFFFSGIISDFQKINCEDISPLYLKPSEINLSSQIIKDNPNTIVVFPELNQLNADTMILKCSNFHYEDYIQSFE